MSANYYRIDAVNATNTAGTVEFVRAPNAEDARKAFRREFPDFADWELATTRIKKEDFPVEAELPELVIPPISEVIPGADDHEPTPAQSDRYNAYANEQIKRKLEELNDGGPVPPKIKVRYPHDTVDAQMDSRDTLTLDRRGDLAVIDFGDA